MMVTGQFGKTSADIKQVRTVGQATIGVCLLDLDGDDKVAAAMGYPPGDPKSTTVIQSEFFNEDY